VANVVIGNCSDVPRVTRSSWPGISPRRRGGVMLDTDARIATQARAIYLQAGVSHAMPPGNVAFSPKRTAR
jgi:uncharacterized membrane protein